MYYLSHKVGGHCPKDVIKGQAGIPIQPMDGIVRML
jgi:hypothetical protein